MPPLVIVPHIQFKPKIIVVFNLVVFLSKFPSRKILPAVVTIVASPLQDDTQLTQTELQSTISTFFRLRIETITNIRLIRRHSLFRLLDTYTVDYTELFPTPNLRSVNYRPSRKCRFVFQTARRKSLLPGFPLLGASPFDPSFSLVLQSSPILLSSNQDNTVIVSQSERKPIKVLAAIFNKTFIMETSQSQPINVQRT